MIDPRLHLDSIEKLMALMEQYSIDEVCVDFINIKKSRFKTPEPTDKEILDKHTSIDEAKAIASHRIAEIETFLNGEKI